MRAQLGIAVGGVGVGETRTGQDCVALDAIVQALLAESQTLEHLETESVCCAAGRELVVAAVHVLVHMYMHRYVYVYACTCQETRTAQEKNLLHRSIFEDLSAYARLIDSRAMALSVVIDARVLELPRIEMRVVLQPRIVIATVQILQDAGDYLGLFVRQIERFDEHAQRRDWSPRKCCREERRDAEDLPVCDEETSFGSHSHGNHVWSG